MPTQPTRHQSVHATGSPCERCLSSSPCNHDTMINELDRLAEPKTRIIWQREFLPTWTKTTLDIGRSLERTWTTDPWTIVIKHYKFLFLFSFQQTNQTCTDLLPGVKSQFQPSACLQLSKILWRNSTYNYMVILRQTAHLKSNSAYMRFICNIYWLKKNKTQSWSASDLG